VAPDRIVGDKGYSYTTVRAWLDAHAIAHTIPTRSDQPAIPDWECQSPRSGGHCYELVELLGWCHPAEGLARTFVELGGDGVEAVVGEGVEVEAAGRYWRSSPLVFSLVPRC
jgi:hypothetical protein